MTLTPLEIEARARIRVKEIKKFYTNLTLYGGVCVGTVLIWGLSGGGYFWPLWVMLGWGVGIFLEALSLNLLPKLEALLPFLSRNWEEKLYQKILTEESIQKTTSPIEKPSNIEPVLPSLTPDLSTALEPLKSEPPIVSPKIKKTSKVSKPLPVKES